MIELSTMSPKAVRAYTWLVVRQQYQEKHILVESRLERIARRIRLILAEESDLSTVGVVEKYDYLFGSRESNSAITTF